MLTFLFLNFQKIPVKLYNQRSELQLGSTVDTNAGPRGRAQDRIQNVAVTPNYGVADEIASYYQIMIKVAQVKRKVSLTLLKY